MASMRSLKSEVVETVLELVMTSVNLLLRFAYVVYA
jgi:hypothetical protein